MWDQMVSIYDPDRHEDTIEQSAMENETLIQQASPSHVSVFFDWNPPIY